MTTMLEVIAKVSGAPRCVPPISDQDGYHWVRRFRGGPAIPLHWNATWHRNADRGWGMWGQPDREGEWEYIGPCPVLEWQPIETAPRDDIEIMVCDARIHHGFFQIVCWTNEAKSPLGHGWEDPEGSYCYHPEAFTHWMPLPAPPRASDADR